MALHARSNVCFDALPAKSPGLVLTAILLLVCGTALTGRASAQLTQVVEDQKAPIPGAGHDYIHFLNETVNPAVGQPSVRIDLPTPGDRGIHAPFMIEYNSNQQARFIPGSGGPGDNAGAWSGNGWSYLFPTLSVALQHQELFIPPSAGGPQSCTWYTNFLFTGLDGQNHDLEMAQLPPSWNDTEGCALLNPNLTGDGASVLNGGDAKVQATSDSAGIQVAAHDGTVYTFAFPSLQVDESDWALPSSVEDRNGNVLKYAAGSGGAVTVTDSDGRTLISLSSFDSSSGDTVQIAGTPLPYTITWTAPSYAKLTTTPQTDPNNSGQYCNAGGGLRYGTGQEISGIQLPNGQAYNFKYDPNSGFLQEIDWPSGARVVYTWEMSPQPNLATPSSNNTDDGVSDDYVTSYLYYTNGLTSTYGQCDGRYAIPVVTSRTVYDGPTRVEEQDFTYITTWPSNWVPGGEPWTSRQTTVVTHDEVSGTAFTTTYTYAPYTLPTDPEVDLQSGSNVEAVEKEVDVCSGATGACTPTTVGFLRQTTQSSLDPQLPPPVVDTRLDHGKVSELDRQFDSNLEISDLYEYDYGSGSRGSLLRHTHIDYASFAAPPDYPSPDIFDAPSHQIVCNGSDQPVAETDYSYDGGSITGAGVNVGRDPAYNGNATAPRANITSITKWTAVSGSSCTYQGASRSGALTSTFTWDDTGNVLSSADPAQNITQYAWGNAVGSPPSNSDAFLLQVTNALGQTDRYSWDYATGHMLSHSGKNVDDVTQFSYLDPNSGASDPFGRLRTITYPPGDGETKITYGDVPGDLYTEIQREFDTSGNWTGEYTLFDGLGQPVGHSTLDPDNGWDRIETSYNGLGQVAFRSYPCAATEPTGAPVCTVGDTFSYDALGRPLTVTHSDGSVITTSYAGAATQIQDEGNAVDANGNVTQRVTRILQHDSLGRLTSVCEVSGNLTAGSDATAGDCHLDIDGSNLQGFLTTYQYDALGNLTGVSQGAESRSFTYDSLSRLLSASNPESGLTSYVYDADGNVVRKTDANQTVTTYTFDALNRMLSKSYALPGGNPYGVVATSPVTFQYDTDTNGCTDCDTIGRMTQAANGTVVLNWTSFDPMGRPEALDTVIGGTTYHSSLAYDPLGFPGWQLLPSGRQLYLTENSAGRPRWIGDGQYTSFSYIQARYYNAFGQPDDEYLGNGLLQGWHHDARGRLIKVDLEDPNSPAYTNWRMDMDIDYLPDSDVADIVDNMGTGAQDQDYSYDQMNRLLQWTSDWGGLICNFAIDRYGNLAPNPPGSACGMPIPLSFNANNRIVGDIYDADGNPLGNGSGEQWSWNAENQLAQYQASSPATGAQYVYDGLGRRTEETVDGVTTLYLRNALGRVVDEVTGSNWTDSVIVPGAERMAIVSGPADGTPGGTDHVNYLTADQVGTTRVITGQDGTNVANCSQNSTYPYGSFFTFTPFGAELDCSQSTTDFKFTGKPRDPETGLDDFGARYNSSSLGRFMTPDPLGGHLIDPQSLNKYAYALNNPVTLTDPTGLDVWLQGCGNESDTCHNNYVGTWDKNKKTFTRTHLKGDLRKTATLGRHGISVKYDGHTYQGVWDTNKGENTPVMVSGAGALSGFAARVTGNCGGTCVANGQMLTAHLKSPTNLAFGVFNSLNGAPGWRKNPGWEGALDFFHPGATNFHGYAQNDPEGLSSTHLPIVLAPNATVPWHVDQRYAWEDGVGFVQHTGSAIHSIFNSLLGGGGQ